MSTPCPGGCGGTYDPDRRLPEYCSACGEYVDVLAAQASTTDATPATRSILRDTRSEDERKADARPAVEAHGWLVVDTEQGYRPTHCPECKHRLPGGGSTRVRRGFPDWICMGHGVVAFLEWKSHTGSQTDHQADFEADCEGAGVPYAVVRTTAEALSYLDSLIRRPAA